MLGPFFVFRATFGRYWGAMQLFEQLIIHKEPLFICSVSYTHLTLPTTPYV